MRKLLIILSLSIFLYNGLGYYLFYEIQQHQIKTNVRGQLIKMIPDNELSRFVVVTGLKNQLNWSEYGREFSYNNQMYDVVRSVVAGDSIIYFCLPDNDETALNRKLDEHVIDNITNSPSLKENGKTFVKSIKKDNYFQRLSSFCFINPGLEIKYYFRFNFPEKVFKEVIKPPPKAGISDL